MAEDSYPKSAKKICKEFYDLVEKRKDALVRQLLSSPKDITTSFTPKQKHLASFLKEAEKYCKQEKDRYGIDTDDFAFAIVNKGSSSFLPYLCFRFFEVFCSTNRNVERFLFFEIYYTGGIFSVLMRRGRYDSGNEGFAAFDMGRREWSLAKAQISFWQGFLKTKTDVIYYLSYPQQVLLDYFTHGSDHELMYILKRLEERQIKLEEKQARLKEDVFDDDKKEIEKKIGKLKKKRKEDIYDLREAENERMRRIAGFSPFDEIWPVVSYVTLLGAAPLLDDAFSPRFLLNLRIDGEKNGLISALQGLLSTFALHRDGALAETITYTSAGKTNAAREQRHLPTVVLYDKKEQLAPVFHSLEGREELLRDGRAVELYAEQLPLLFGPAWIADSRVVNLSASAETLLSASRAESSLAALRELIDGKLYQTVILSMEDGKIRLPQENWEPEELWKTAAKRLGKRLQNSWYAWNAWREEQKLALLSPQYINLAAWLSVLTSSDVQEEIEEGNGVVGAVQKSLRRMENELLNQLAVLRLFLQKMLDGLNTYSEDRPQGEIEARELKRPFTMSFRGKDGDEICVVFTRKLFGEFAKQVVPNCEPEKLIELAYREKILRTNNEKGDMSKIVKLGKKTDRSGKDHSERCYAFCVEQAKNYLGYRVTEPVTPES